MSDIKATDVLANERTFLAYVRTALAFVAFGFVIARFSLVAREVAGLMDLHAPSGASTAFGASMALLGVVTGGYGAYRYVVSGQALRAGTVRPLPEFTAIATGGVIGVVGLFVAWTVFATR